MSPQEQRTVLELHSRWGNRWSRIARRLPGRTDNEIKNYWRTHMRKKAQEKKQKHPLSSSSSSSSLCHSQPPNTPSMDSNVDVEVEKEKLGRNGSSTSTLEAMQGEKKGEDGGAKGCYSMDQIWNEIASPEMTSCVFDEDFRDGGYSFTSPTMASPLWDYRYDLQWKVEDEDMKQWVPMGGLSVSNYQHERE